MERIAVQETQTRVIIFNSTSSLAFLSWKEEARELTVQAADQMLETAQSNTFGSFVEPINMIMELKIIRAIYVPWLILSSNKILFTNVKDFPEYLC